MKLNATQSCDHRFPEGNYDVKTWVCIQHIFINLFFSQDQRCIWDLILSNCWVTAGAVNHLHVCFVSLAAKIAQLCSCLCGCITSLLGELTGFQPEKYISLQNNIINKKKTVTLKKSRYKSFRPCSNHWTTEDGLVSHYAPSIVHQDLLHRVPHSSSTGGTNLAPKNWMQFNHQLFEYLLTDWIINAHSNISKKK